MTEDPEDRAPVVFSVAVEGNLDQAVLRRLIEDCGSTLGPVHGRKGKNHIKDKLQGYNNAAKFSPWVVVVGLDGDANCALELRNQWLREPATRMLFRIAVREVEAWLLGDPERLARFMRVARTAIPSQPENILDAKRAMVDLGRRSTRREIREELVPRIGGGTTVGTGYTTLLSEFVLDTRKGWRPEVAAKACNSLDRFIGRVRAVGLGASG